MHIDRQLQQLLARELCDILAGWSNAEVVNRFAIYPARVSELRHGNLARFSIGKLVRFIAALGYDIEISIRPAARPAPTIRRATASVVRHAR